MIPRAAALSLIAIAACASGALAQTRLSTSSMTCSGAASFVAARGAVVISEPIPTSKSMDSEELRLRVEIALRAATARADELAGLAPDTAPAAKPVEVTSAPEAERQGALEHRGT
jgi:hypothetical protein